MGECPPDFGCMDVINQTPPDANLGGFEPCARPHWLCSRVSVMAADCGYQLASK